jgi:hypothetical protein
VRAQLLGFIVQGGAAIICCKATWPSPIFSAISGRDFAADPLALVAQEVAIGALEFHRG